MTMRITTIGIVEVIVILNIQQYLMQIKYRMKKKKASVKIVSYILVFFIQIDKPWIYVKGVN
uniref:Uncharacterized protein n=1 Tax=Rhizophagus irregularis (strain DAOM 181602 / DAOM 197198 / MUCL 43194) TaxID=747089 RepID=U9T5P6_RHIID